MYVGSPSSKNLLDWDSDIVFTKKKHARTLIFGAQDTTASVVSRILQCLAETRKLNNNYVTKYVRYEADPEARTRKTAMIYGIMTS